MALYEIIICNSLDNTNYSKFILSNEPLQKNTFGLNSLCKIQEDFGEYIREVKIPHIELNIWFAEELDELNEIKQKLIK